MRSNQTVKAAAAASQHAAGSKQVYVSPIWLTNWAYYATAAVLSLGLFFLLWTVLAEENEAAEVSWFPAFLISVFFFAFAAGLHGILLRRVRNKYLLRREERKFPVRSNLAIENGKFTLEKHTAAINKLQHKSADADAANPQLAETHLEVYRACGDYLEQIEVVLPTVHAGSPRLAAFRSGQERVRGLQKHHLLSWAEEESRQLLREAQIRVTTNEKVEIGQRALEVIDAAMQIYPNEPKLTESAIAVQEFIAASYVAHWVELAERAAFKENYEQAIDHYRDALFYLSREAVDSAQRETTAAQIELEIKRLENLINKRTMNKKSLLAPQNDDTSWEAEN